MNVEMEFRVPYISRVSGLSEEELRFQNALQGYDYNVLHRSLIVTLQSCVKNTFVFRFGTLCWSNIDRSLL